MQKLPCNVPTAHQEQFGVQCLAQGHFNMQLGGAGIRTSDLLITKWPTLSPDSRFTVTLYPLTVKPWSNVCRGRRNSSVLRTGYVTHTTHTHTHTHYTHTHTTHTHTHRAPESCIHLCVSELNLLQPDLWLTEPSSHHHLLPEHLLTCGVFCCHDPKFVWSVSMPSESQEAQKST